MNSHCIFFSGDRMVEQGRLNVYYRFQEKAKANPDRVFLVFENKEYTFRDIEKGKGLVSTILQYCIY